MGLQVASISIQSDARSLLTFRQDFDMLIQLTKYSLPSVVWPAVDGLDPPDVASTPEIYCAVCTGVTNMVHG